MCINIYLLTYLFTYTFTYTYLKTYFYNDSLSFLHPYILTNFTYIYTLSLTYSNLCPYILTNFTYIYIIAHILSPLSIYAYELYIYMLSLTYSHLCPAQEYTFYVSTDLSSISPTTLDLRTRLSFAAIGILSPDIADISSANDSVTVTGAPIAIATLISAVHSQALFVSYPIGGAFQTFLALPGKNSFLP